MISLFSGLEFITDILLDPYPAQDLDRRDLPQPVRSPFAGEGS
ncbi:hypothetical protein H4W31_006636 [Plantactinospora soyae]|uniref:Uncharacterized protein n=1 Tax=Plantactinospora soyae TaxID=1544732 RepID=A0A927MA64_9ACTN|nr:hypothetical protein [Plantactinospora soyae]